MKTAEQIMKKKGPMRAELEKHLSKEEADALWRQATEKLAGILAQYPDLPRSMRFHTESRIFPSAAIYLTAKERLGEKTAVSVVENAAVALTDSLGRKLARLMRLPGMRSLFVRIWDPLVRKVFGPDNGFRNVFYPKQKGEYRMDVLACPYCRYFTELGCPELTRIYCENDERTYGNLPGIAFERTGTLGKGADRCDFRIRKE
ncbi:MAG: L-2-amino-thiazoline-4-carboxylic acid hydrolase [Clostridia bacterium]|nr:L-2-amino-thiazoline-4-carboxylic acid hydrolase [Clostridia bacterium]